MKNLLSFLLFLCLSIPFVQAQPNQLSINGNTGIDKEISSLMNELDLSADQKMVLGMLILKYSMEFDYKAFNDGSKTKQYSIIKKKIKQLDKDLKEVLNKDQFKIYKKRKKAIRKQLMQG